MRKWRAAFSSLLALLCVYTVSAAGPSLTAVLSSSETVTGQPVQLEIKVSGATGAALPQQITVDGLDIRYSGQSQLVEGRNFQFTYSSVYNYTVMPLKAGTFKIPPQSIGVSGNSIQTPALTLNVADSPGRSARSSRRAGTTDPNRIGFIELVLAKSTVYVGEMIPTEVRVGFDARVPVESLGSGIQISGQGFTTQKFPEPRQTIETVNGKSYQVWVFKTAISAARPGKIEIGPAEMTPVVRIARSNPRRQALPNDLFDMDDPFFNSFFNDPAFQPSTPQELSLKSQAQSIEVKSLPPNAPPGFAGAIGSFTLQAEAKPKSVQIGDPITISATLTGRGNFDRVTAPELADDRGWHKYPPSGTFKKDDDVGISGAKTFETVLSANEPKQNVPPLAFSYFDPVKATYVTLRSDPLAVRVEGGAAAAPSTAPAAGTRAPTPAVLATPAAKPNGILHQLSEAPAKGETFAPLYERREFWLAQLIPLVGLIGFIAWMTRRARLADRDARRAAALQQQIVALQRKLRSSDARSEQYLADASRAVQLKTALKANVNPDAVDSATVSSVFRADDATRRRLEQLFQQRDEIRYSGGSHNGSGKLSDDDRRHVLELIESLHE